MSVLDSKKTYRNLKSKGFTDSTKRSDDHKWVDFFYKKKYVLSTKVSHGGKDIRNYLIKKMSVQCHLDKNDFMDLAKCPLSKEDYLEILEKKGLLE